MGQKTKSKKESKSKKSLIPASHKLVVSLPALVVKNTHKREDSIQVFSPGTPFNEMMATAIRDGAGAGKVKHATYVTARFTLFQLQNMLAEFAPQ